MLTKNCNRDVNNFGRIVFGPLLTMFVSFELQILSIQFLEKNLISWFDLVLQVHFVTYCLMQTLVLQVVIVLDLLHIGVMKRVFTVSLLLKCFTASNYWGEHFWVMELWRRICSQDRRSVQLSWWLISRILLEMEMWRYSSKVSYLITSTLGFHTIEHTNVGDTAILNTC